MEASTASNTDGDAVETCTAQMYPVVPKLDIAAAVPIIQEFAQTPEMNAQIVAGDTHSVTFRSEAITLREIPVAARFQAAKASGSVTGRSPEKIKLVLTPRSKIKLSDAFRNYQKSSFPSVRIPLVKSSVVDVTAAESSKNGIHDGGSSEFRKLNAALSKDGRRKFQNSKMNSSHSVVSISERTGFTTDYRDLSLNTKRYLEAIDHMKCRDVMRLEDNQRRLAIAQNEKHKNAVSGEDVEKFFHKATTLACASDSVYVRRDAAQAVATLMISSLPSDVLMSQPESLSGMLDLFQSEKIDASVKLKVLHSFACIVEDDRYKVLTLQQRVLFQRFISLDHKKSKSFANGKAKVLSAMTFTSDCGIKDDFQNQGGFNEICRMIEDARDVQTIENLIPGVESLLCDPHDTRNLHWTASCIADIIKMSACDYPRVRIAALNGITNCCRSVHLQVQQHMSNISSSCSQYKLLLAELDPIDFRTINPESIGEYLFRLKSLRSLLSVSSDPIATMGDILPILLKFIRTSPECLQHESTLAARKSITADMMFRDNLTIGVAFARLIRPGALVQCPKKFKGTTTHCAEKPGGSTTRRVTGLDSDLSPRGRKLPSENLTSRSLDTFPSTLSNSKAQEIIDGEHITSNILALSIEILSQIFNHGNDELRSIFSSPEIQFSNCLETIIIHSSSSRVHKEAGFLLCDFGRHALLDASSSKTMALFSEPRYLQTLCALLAASDMGLCERILHFLLFDVVPIGTTRDIMRCIGIADLLKNLGQRSGNLRIQAYSAILLTHLSMPEDVHASDAATLWFKELHTVATLTGSKTKEAESLAGFHAIINFLTKQKAAGGGGWLRSALKTILPWMRQITSEDVSNSFDKQRRRICSDIVCMIKMNFYAVANHSVALKWLARVRASLKRRDQIQREKDDPKFIQCEVASTTSK